VRGERVSVTGMLASQQGHPIRSEQGEVISGGRQGRWYELRDVKWAVLQAATAPARAAEAPGGAAATDRPTPRFRVVYAWGTEGGDSYWLLSLDRSGTLWDGGFRVSDAGLRRTLSRRRPSNPPFTIHVRVAREADTSMAVVSGAMARVIGIASEVMPQRNSLVLYLHSETLTAARAGARAPTTAPSGTQPP